MRRLALLALSSTLALLALVLVPELPAQAEPLPDSSPQWRQPNPALPAQAELDLVPVAEGLALVGAAQPLRLPLPEGALSGATELGNDGLHERVSLRFEAQGSLEELGASMQERLALHGELELSREPGWLSLRQSQGPLELELVMWKTGEAVSGEWTVQRVSAEAQPPLSSPMRYALVEGGVLLACEQGPVLGSLPLPPGELPEAVTFDGQGLLIQLDVDEDCGELSLWAADRLVDQGARVVAEDLDLRWSEGDIELALSSHPSGSGCLVNLEAQADCLW